MSAKYGSEGWLEDTDEGLLYAQSILFVKLGRSTDAGAPAAFWFRWT